MSDNYIPGTQIPMKPMGRVEAWLKHISEVIGNIFISKQDNSLGSENAGKILIADENGDLQPGNAGDLPDIVELKRDKDTIIDPLFGELEELVDATMDELNLFSSAVELNGRYKRIFIIIDAEAAVANKNTTIRAYVNGGTNVSTYTAQRTFSTSDNLRILYLCVISGFVIGFGGRGAAFGSIQLEGAIASTPSIVEAEYISKLTFTSPDTAEGSESARIRIYGGK